MKSKFYSLLNIKPSEIKIVKQLFLVQFFLGVATSFLFLSALTFFLSSFAISELPKVSLLAGALLVGANYFYAKLEARFSAKKLLQTIILFSIGSILITWLEATFYPVAWLPFFLSAWNMVVYMLVGYAFWGMAAIIFNVRESKRIFSIVGSGDIPAKIIGYVAVGVLAPIIGVQNILIISVVAFGIAYYYLHHFYHATIEAPTNHHHHHEDHSTVSSHKPFVQRYFHNRLILVIALWSLIGFFIYTLIDYTFITEIKIRFKTSHELAAFLGLYFAVGRLAAILFKILFSSRVISRLGLTNTLLIPPLVLILITSFIFFTSHTLDANLLIFGILVLVSEVLKSAVQDPAFFVLFQPLDPHGRLKGHLITKGYTMPFALVGVAIFVLIFRDAQSEISITFVSGTLICLLIIWAAAVFLIKREYLHTLLDALKKGYFTGSQLFLNDEPVRNLLLLKTESSKPKEVMLALELLEKSGYTKLHSLFLAKLHHPAPMVVKYVLTRIMHHHQTAGFPIIQQLLTNAPAEVKPDLIKASYFLNPAISEIQTDKNIDIPANRKAALLGLVARNEPVIVELVQKKVKDLALSTHEPDNELALEIIAEAPKGAFNVSLQSLLHNHSSLIRKKTIEVVGIAKAYDLLPLVIQTVEQNQATATFQNALVNFGDKIFAPAHLPALELSSGLKAAVIKTTGKIKGEYSNQYLKNLLLIEGGNKESIINAFWSKKAHFGLADQKIVLDWAQEKLFQSKLKIDIYKQLVGNPQLTLLLKAIQSEIQQDLQVLLRGFALLYDRSRIDRVLELLKHPNTNRISNAIELLELQIPKRYFLQVDVILEFILDISTENNKSLPVNAKDPAYIIEQILTKSQVGFNDWTRSVACYLIPNFNNSNLKNVLKQVNITPESRLFTETKQFVLSETE